MKIPDWWEAVLLAAASWRIWWLLAQDDITAPLRYRLKPRAADFVECPFCAGFYVSLVVYLFWIWFPTETLVVLMPFALNAGLIAIYKALSSD